MKGRIFYLVLLTCLMGVVISTPAMAVPIANLNLVNSPHSVGDTFNVEVLANADNNGLGLLSFGFDVTFDQGGIFNYTGQ